MIISWQPNGKKVQPQTNNYSSSGIINWQPSNRQNLITKYKPKNPVIKSNAQQNLDPLQQVENGIGNIFSAIGNEFKPRQPFNPTKVKIGEIKPTQLPSGLKLDFTTPSQNASGKLKQKPIASQSVKLGQTTLSQYNPTIWDKVTQFFNDITGNDATTQKALAMNAYALKKVYPKQTKNISLSTLAQPGGNISKNSPMEDITKQLGIRNMPTNSEFTNIAMTAALGLGLAEAPLATLKAVGIFSAVNSVKSGFISALTGKGFNPLSGATLSDLTPNANPTIKNMLDIIDFLGTGAITGAIYKTSPRIGQLLTRDTLVKYNLPQTIEISPKGVRDISLGLDKSQTADYVKSLGMTSDQWRNAVKNGIKVEIPAEKVVTIADKPYWAKIKSILGREASIPKTTTFTNGKTAINDIKGLLQPGEYTPQEIRKTILNSPLKNDREAKQIIQESIKAEQQGKNITIGIADQQPGKNLTQEEAISYVNDNNSQAKQDYFARVKQEYGTPNVITADEGKYIIPGYNGSNAPAYHEAASQLAKQIYDEKLISQKGVGNNTVMFMSGGTGVGKTTALRTAGIDFKEYPIIYDTNLSGNSAIEKIQKALDNGYKIEIQYVQRDPVVAFENGVIPRVKSRNRIVTVVEHIVRHAEAFANLEKIQNHFGDQVTISYIDNTGDKGQAKLVSLADLPKFDYNKEELGKVLNEKLKEAIKSGKLTQQQANAIAEKDLWSKDSGSIEPQRTQATVTKPSETPITASYDSKGNLITAKKPVYNSAQSRAIQSQFTDTLDRLRQTASNEQDLIKGVNEAVSKAETLAKGDKTVLAGIRTALNKEMFGLAGNSGNYKQDYAILQTMKQDPGIGEYIKALEDHINRISENMLKPAQEAVVPKATTSKTLEPVGTGKVQTSKLAERLTKAMGLYKDIPQYNTASNNDQVQMATDLVAKDPKQAFDIAMGTQNAPKGMLPAFTYEAVRLQAEAAGDITTLKALATQSKLSLQGTAAGQFIQSLSQVDPDSTVANMKRAIEQKKAEAKAKLKGKSVEKATTEKTDKLKSEIKKAAPKKDDWQSFIDSIQC